MRANLLLRYIISQPLFRTYISSQAYAGTWPMLKQRMTSSCAGVWEAIKGTLCIDSPEGHQTNDRDEDDLNIGMKDTLSFAWRALKESRYACGIGHARYGKPLMIDLVFYSTLFYNLTLALNTTIQVSATTTLRKLVGSLSPNWLNSDTVEHSLLSLEHSHSAVPNVSKRKTLKLIGFLRNGTM